MTARLFWNEEDMRGHRPRLQWRSAFTSPSAPLWMLRTFSYWAYASLGLQFRGCPVATVITVRADFRRGTADSATAHACRSAAEALAMARTCRAASRAFGAAGTFADSRTLARIGTWSLSSALLSKSERSQHCAGHATHNQLDSSRTRHGSRQYSGNAIEE